MDYKRTENTLLLRLDKGEEVTESVLSVAKKEGITFAEISGIGATDDFTASVFDREKGDYEKNRFTGDHEILSLTGTVTEKDGAPYLHLHIVCAGSGGRAVGGHLLSARISLTAEIVLQIARIGAQRKKDENLGINRIFFDETGV